MVLIDLTFAKRIVQRFGLANPTSVVPISGGVINQSYLFGLADGTTWVCRVDVEDRGDKLAHEARVYRWLWDRAPGLPIATAYHLDTGRDLLPSPYALLPRLPGSNLGIDIEHLPEHLRATLLLAVGGLLRRLHELTDSAASLVPHEHAHQRWRQFVEVWFDEMLSRCESRLGYVPPWAPRARAWMMERRSLVPEAPRRVFLHGDFHFGNLQYEVAPSPRVSGCFDLEWAWSGHATCDLLHIHEAIVRYPVYGAPFLAGYGLATWPEELSVYRLIHSISVLGVAVVEQPQPLWDLVAWHRQVISNVITDRGAFVGLVPSY